MSADKILPQEKARSWDGIGVSPEKDILSAGPATLRVSYPEKVIQLCRIHAYDLSILTDRGRVFRSDGSGKWKEVNLPDFNKGEDCE